VSESPFASLYAATYDALYRDKDYDGEVALVERLFREHGEGAIRSVLDLGSGTGSHAIRLADLGYEVVGIERSAAMLEVARRKRSDLELHEADIRDFDLGRTFDAVLLLFAVLGYQTSDEDVLAALDAARRHLRPGGLVVFDFWYGPAVLHQRPSPRFRRLPLERGELLRSVTAELDEERHLCRVRYELRRVEGERVVEQAEEEHLVRFFFRDELEALLERSGLSLVRLAAFPEVDLEPDEATWNALAVAVPSPA
jgi:SAM-dependent methyltransferase